MSMTDGKYRIQPICDIFFDGKDVNVEDAQSEPALEGRVVDGKLVVEADAVRKANAELNAGKPRNILRKMVGEA